MVISSPYSRRGLVWEKFKEYYGRDGDTLIIQAPTELLNPTIDKAIIARAFEDDPASANAEWAAQFRSDIESFIDRDVVEAAVASGIAEIPPASDIKYIAFVDPSGGSSDSMTLAIAHNDDGTAVLDCLRESKPPFSPDAVVTEFAETLKSYGVRSVTGDRYAGEWPREKFRDAGIKYDLTDKVKSAIYLDTLPMLNSGRVRLLENKRLITQLCALERRTSRGGKDSIDHPPRAHDDVANSACGALVLAGAKSKMVDFTDDDYAVGQPLASSLGEWGPMGSNTFLN